MPFTWNNDVVAGQIIKGTNSGGFEEEVMGKLQDIWNKNGWGMFPRTANKIAGNLVRNTDWTEIRTWIDYAKDNAVCSADKSGVNVSNYTSDYGSYHNSNDSSYNSGYNSGNQASDNTSVYSGYNFWYGACYHDNSSAAVTNYYTYDATYNSST